MSEQKRNSSLIFINIKYNRKTYFPPLMLDTIESLSSFIQTSPIFALKTDETRVIYRIFFVLLRPLWWFRRKLEVKAAPKILVVLYFGCRIITADKYFTPSFEMSQSFLTLAFAMPLEKSMGAEFYNDRQKKRVLLIDFVSVRSHNDVSFSFYPIFQFRNEYHTGRSFYVPWILSFLVSVSRSIWRAKSVENSWGFNSKTQPA